MVPVPHSSATYSVRGGEWYSVKCKCEDAGKKRLGFSYVCGQNVRVRGRKTPLRFSNHLCRCVHKECHKESWFWKWMRELELFDDKVPVSLEEKGVRLNKGKSDLFHARDVDLPKGMKAFSSKDVPDYAVDYLLGRHFDVEELTAKFGIMYAPRGCKWVSADSEGNKKQNVLEQPKMFIPVYARRRLIGWQFRAIDSGLDMDRFYTHGSDLSNALYNMDRSKYYARICIVEGPADTWRVSQLSPHGISGAGLLSKGLSDARIQICANLWGYFCEGYLMLDSMRKDEGNTPKVLTKMAQSLVDAGAFPSGMHIVHLPHGDPAEFKPEELLDMIEETRASGPSVVPLEQLGESS